MATTGPARWPGLQTFPGTDQYPGQGNYPIYRFLMSFDSFANPTPTYVDLTSYVRGFSISRGRPNELEAFDAGTASVVFDNSDRIFGPAPGATYANNVMNRLWIYAEYSGATYDRFKGYVEAWDHAWDQSGIYDATATARCVDEFKVLALARLPLSGTVDSTFPSVQIRTFLDLIHNHASRNIRASASGASSMAATTLDGQSALDAIRNAVKAELPPTLDAQSNAAFFVSRAGEVVFLDARHRTVAPWNTVQIYFADIGTSSSYPYLQVSFDESDSFLFNHWYVTRTGGTTQEATDAASINAYGERGKFLDVPLLFDADASALARSGLATFKDPMLRVNVLTPDTSNRDGVELILQRDLMDRIRVSHIPPGDTSAIDQSVWIQSISESGQANTPGPGIIPSISFGVSPR